MAMSPIRAVAALCAAASTLAPCGAGATASGALDAQIIDDYDPGTGILSIPLVQAGTAFYRDVQVTLDRILSIGTASNTSGVFDRYDFATGQLTIPVVRVGDRAYFNVVITPKTILGVGGQVQSYSVPTDLAKVSYPSSYQTPTTSEAQINTDPCKLDIDYVTYPGSWLGRYPLPAIQDAPLKSDIQRGVMLKDVGLQPGNPAFILPSAPGAPAGCTGDLHAALDRTVARLKALGSDFLSVTQWHWASNREDGSWYFTAAEDTFGSLTDADLGYLVQKAHAAGLKVLMRNQIQGFFDRNNPNVFYLPPATMDNFQKWFGAWQDYIAERSVYFQSIGLDIWELGCGVCMYWDTGDGSAEASALFASEYAKALATMKKTFTGKTLMGTPPWFRESSIASQVDIIQVGVGAYNPSADLTDRLTVAYYKSQIFDFAQGSINYFDSLGKTVLLTYWAQSRGDFFTLPGYMEETACTPGLGSFENPRDACIERSTTTDFSLQAIVHEASLEAINSLTPQKSKLMVEIFDYWETDSLAPYTAFPNIATSIRNKPAEGIVKAWFAR
jgi:hypothetical protein